jgi:hypothetical protein
MVRRLIRRFVDDRDLRYPRFDCLAAPNRAAPRIDLAGSRNSRFRRFNSRFGRENSRFAVDGNSPASVWPTALFLLQIGGFEAKIAKFPVILPVIPAPTGI